VTRRGVEVGNGARRWGGRGGSAGKPRSLTGALHKEKRLQREGRILEATSGRGGGEQEQNG